jgi:hypothetical protein
LVPFASARAGEGSAVIAQNEPAEAKDLPSSSGSSKSGERTAAAVEAGSTSLAPELSPKAALELNDKLRETITRARSLMSAGQSREAVELLLVCYDEATRISDTQRQLAELISGMPGTSMQESVQGLIARLATSYAPAREALIARRAVVRARLPEDQNLSALVEFIRLNRLLDEQGVTIAFYDTLPVDDARRPRVAQALDEELRVRKRYADALLGREWVSLPKVIEQGLAFAARATGRSRESTLKSTVTFAVCHIEILVGVGKFPEAQALAKRVLETSDTAEVREQLAAAAARAGHADALSAVLKPASP